MINNYNYQSHVSSFRSRKGGGIIPILLVAVYFFSFIAPLAVITIRWYMGLGLGIAVFILNGGMFTAKSGKLFLAFWGLEFIAALLSIFRAPDTSNQLYLLIGWSVSMLSFFMLIPTVAQVATRKWLLFALFFAAIAWCLHIRSQMVDSRYLQTAYYLSGMGNDKNYIALILSMSITALFYILIFWRCEAINKWNTTLVKMSAVIAFLYFLYNLIFTYSRSGLIVTGIGLLSVIAVYRIKIGGGVRSVIMIIVIAFVIYQFIPLIISLAPRWVGYFGFEQSGLRFYLIQKTLAIIADNPWIGIGIDGTKSAYISSSIEFARGLPHNLLLKTWAERGLLGLIGYVICLIYFFRKFKEKFFSLPLFDQTWAIISIPLGVMMFFLDMESLVLFLLVILVAIFPTEVN